MRAHTAKGLALDRRAGGPKALSPCFRLRERARTLDPALTRAKGCLARWQWYGMGLAITAAVLSARVRAAILRGVSHRRPGGTALAWPARLMAAALLLQLAVLRLGISQAGLSLVGTFAGIVLILSVAVFACRLSSLPGAWSHGHARKTTTHIDGITSPP